MASSNIKLFDENKGNMLSDSEFSISNQRLNGLQTGVASSQLQNKAMYQASLVAYAIAQVMMQNGKNANDTDAVSAFVANLSGTMLQKVYDIATTAEAQAGVATGKWMSPALVKTAFDKFWSDTYKNLVLPVSKGGTGLASAPSLLVNLASTTAVSPFTASPRPGVTGTLPVARGGTGVTANPSMLTNLGSTSAASVFAASPRPGVTGTLPVANGGTGQTSLANLMGKLVSDTNAARVVYGSYTGNGKFGDTHKNSAVVGFTPKVFWIYGTLSTDGSNTYVMYYRPDGAATVWTSNYSLFYGSAGNRSPNTVVEWGNTVYWYTGSGYNSDSMQTNYSAAQHNVNGKTYFWIAFG